MKIQTTGHVVEGNLVLGTVRGLFLGDKKGHSRVSIYDEIDQCLKEILVHTALFEKLVEPRRVEGARIILGARSYVLRTRDGKTFIDVFELIQVVSGPLAGQTLVYKNETNPD